MKICAFVAVVIWSAHIGLSAAQQPPNDAEQAARDFLYALYANDAVEYQKRILPEPGSEVMLGRQTLTRDQLDRLRRDVDGVQLRQTSPPALEGTRIIYFTQFRGVVMAVPVQRVDNTWKIDVRYWLAMRKQHESRPQMTDPEMVAKGFLFHILAKRPDALAQFASQPINGEDYTSANNLPHGDLDQILSLCLEMPIVRARPGERALLPSGETAVGSDDNESLLLLGLMGDTEIPFVMRRVDGAWKVVPQKYFEMLRKAGAI